MTLWWASFVTGASVGAIVVNTTWILLLRWKFAAIHALLAPGAAPKEKA
jgi:hypothetical protein